MSKYPIDEIQGQADLARTLAEHFFKNHVARLQVGAVIIEFREPPMPSEAVHPLAELTSEQQDAFLEITEDSRAEAAKQREKQVKDMLFRSA